MHKQISTHASTAHYETPIETVYSGCIMCEFLDKGTDVSILCNVLSIDFDKQKANEICMPV